MHQLGLRRFAKLFGTSVDEMSRECADLIEGADFRYAVLEGKSRDAVYVRVLRTLESDLETAWRHRKARWEDGWTQNLREFTASGYDLRTLVPKFVKQNEVARLEGSYILPADPEFETHFVDVLRTWLFKTFCVEAGHIYEFGCGLAHNLVALAQYELYDQNDLFDYVAAAYLRKRGYLQGFLPRLRELEREGVIEILQVQRTFGSLYHDGYSFVVWRPRGV